MNKRVKITLLVAGIVTFFGLIFGLWAVDTNKIGVFADTETVENKTVQDLKELPSPDESVFNRMFTAVAKFFSR